MDVPAASDRVLSSSPVDPVQVEISGRISDVPNKKRKRSLSKENVENAEKRQKGKSSGKVASRKDAHLSEQAAEEKRRRVNEQERYRQKQIADAIERLRRLDMPFNPNLPNHKDDSKMYIIRTATAYIAGLAKMKEDHDNGIVHPEQLGVARQSQRPVSEQHGTASGKNGHQNLSMERPQKPAHDFTTGRNLRILGGVKQESHGETINCQSSSHNVPECSKKLADVSNHQKYPYGNMYRQKNMIQQVSKVPIPRAQSSGYQSVQGLFPSAPRFMVPFPLDPNGAYNNGSFPMNHMTMSAINGYHIMMPSVHFQQCGPHNASKQFSQFLVNSATPVGTTTLLSQPLHFPSAGTPTLLSQSRHASSPAATPTLRSQPLHSTSPADTPTLRSQPLHSSSPADTPTLMSLPLHATPRYVERSQAGRLSGTPSPLIRIPLKATTAATTSSPDMNQDDSGNFSSCCGNDSHNQALINDSIKSWTDANISSGPTIDSFLPTDSMNCTAGRKVKDNSLALLN